MDIGLFVVLLIFVLILVLLLVLVFSAEKRKKLEKNKKQNAKLSLNEAFSIDAIWDKQSIKSLIREYHATIEESREQKTVANLHTICLQKVVEEIKIQENDRLKYYKFYLDKISILSIKDKINNSEDEFKVLLEGTKERLMGNLNDMDCFHYYEQLWTLKRNENNWKIIDIDYDVEDHEIEELTNFVE